MAFEVDILDIIDQVKKFLWKERGSILGLAVMVMVTFWAWNEILLSIIPDIETVSERLGFNAVYIVVGIVFLVWLWTRKITLPKDKITIGIAPFGIVAVKDHPSGEEQYDMAAEVAEHIYASLHHFREKLGFTDFIHFERLPDRVKPGFNNADRWCRRLGVGILIWGNVRVSGDKMVLEPQFNFLQEPASRFYQHFKTRLNNLPHFELDLDKKDDQSTVLLHYMIYVAMLFAGIITAHRGDYQRADRILAQNMAVLSKPENKRNRTLADVLLTVEFFRARNLHQWGNKLLQEGDAQAAKEKWDMAEKFLFKRSKQIGREIGDKDDIEFLENSYLYGVYLLAKEGKIKEAEQKLRKIRDRIGDESEYLLTLAKIYKQIDVRKAEKLFEKALNKAEKKYVLSEVEEEFGRFYVEHRKWDKAAKTLKSKLKQDEKRPYEPELFDDTGRKELAMAYFQQHRFLKAQEEIMAAAVDQVRNKMKRKLTI